jgi:hypothetical protein
MNTTIKNFAKVLLVAITIFSMTIISSCSKDGVDGKEGPAGTANVYYSPWTQRTFTLGIGGIWFSDYTAPQITQEVFDNGVVLCFWKATDRISQLPFNIGTSKISFDYLVNGIKHQADFNAGAGNFRLRYIIIPGGTPITGKMAIDYKKMSYQEVCKHLNIPE